MTKPLSFLLAAALVLQPALQTTLLGQQTTGTPQPSLPPAPDAKPVGQALMDAQNQAAQVANAFDADAEKRASQVNGPGGKTLTRKEAEQLAIRNNPHISQYKLLALAQNQVVRETRSALLPTLAINATGVGAEQASRISSGTLDSSRMLNHMGVGVELTQ